MKKNSLILLFVLILIFGCVVFVINDFSEIKHFLEYNVINARRKNNMTTTDNAMKKNNKEIFIEDFSKDFELEETGKMTESSSLDWWVNSGAYLYSLDGIGRTVFRDLEQNSKWQIKYKDYNASETDDGFHPQNIFRLITRSKWRDLMQECYFRIDKYILSNDSYRKGSNGLLLFNRYQDGENLYYAGLRVDGTAVIKKKIKGKYFTMAQVPVVEGEYDRNKNPNLLPLDEWIGIRSEVKTVDRQKAQIRLYYKFESDKDWKLALEATDDGVAYGGEAILAEAYAGIRTDFMDVEFDNYKIIKLIK